LENYDEVSYSIYRQRYLELMKLKEFIPDKNNLQIEEVEITGRKPRPRVKTGDFKKNDGQYEFDAEEALGYRDIISYLAYDHNGLWPNGSGPEMTVSVKNGLGPALIVIDGYKLNSQQDAKQYPSDMFETIEVRTPPYSFYLGIEARWGAILLTTVTKPPPLHNKPILGGLVERINGFTTLREFYSPKYTPENINSEIPDYRQTLYWNPLVELLNGHGETSFFTADNLGRYKVFIEGISENGKIFLGGASFEVNE